MKMEKIIIHVLNLQLARTSLVAASTGHQLLCHKPNSK